MYSAYELIIIILIIIIIVMTTFYLNASKHNIIPYLWCVVI